MKPIIPNRSDLAILESLAVFPFLTCDQITRRHFAPSSAAYVFKRLNLLIEKRYLNKRGKEYIRYYPYFYSLALKGVRTIETKPAFYPPHLPNFLQLDHLLMTNEVLLACLQFPTASNCLHDFTLKTMLEVAVPDCRVEISHEGYTYPICFEVHLKTGETKFKKKIGAILQSVRGEYQNVFKTTHITVAYVTDNEKTLTQIIKWTEDELILLGEEHEADLFRFAVVPKKEINSEVLFKGLIFRRPFDPNHITSLI